MWLIDTGDINPHMCLHTRGKSCPRERSHNLTYTSSGIIVSVEAVLVADVLSRLDVICKNQEKHFLFLINEFLHQIYFNIESIPKGIDFCSALFCCDVTEYINTINMQKYTIFALNVCAKFWCPTHPKIGIFLE